MSRISNSHYNLLKILRKQKRLTQKELGELSGISQSYISNLEKNYLISSPTVRQILALSEALNVDEVELFLYFAEKELEFKSKKW